MVENHRSILRADVGPLTIDRGRIVNLPEQLQELYVRDQPGIVFHLHHFGVAGLVRTDLTVSGMLEPAAHIARGRRDNAVELAEGGFHAPEPSPAESGYSFSRHRL